MSLLDRAALAALGGVLAYGAFQWGGVVRTGLHHTPGNADDLAAEAEWAWAHPEEMAVMGGAVRRYSCRFKENGRTSCTSSCKKSRGITIVTPSKWELGGGHKSTAGETTRPSRSALSTTCTICRTGVLASICGSF